MPSASGRRGWWPAEARGRKGHSTRALEVPSDTGAGPGGRQTRGSTPAAVPECDSVPRGQAPPRAGRRGSVQRVWRVSESTWEQERGGPGFEAGDGPGTGVRPVTESYSDGQYGKRPAGHVASRNSLVSLLVSKKCQKARQAPRGVLGGGGQGKGADGVRNGALGRDGAAPERQEDARPESEGSVDEVSLGELFSPPRQ